MRRKQVGRRTTTAAAAVMILVIFLVPGILNVPLRIEAATSPIIISTPIAPNAIASNPDRKLLNYGGYWWAFWTDSSGIYYSSSPDGVSWSAPSLLGSATLSVGSQFSVWLAGGGILYYVISSGGLNASFAVGEGALNGAGFASPGTISIDPENHVATTYTTGSYASIITDYQGNIWVAVPTSNEPNEYVEVWEYCYICGSTSWQRADIITGPTWVSQPGALVSLVPVGSDVGLVYSFEPEGTPGSIEIVTISGGVASTPAQVSENFDTFSATSIGSTIYVAGTYTGSANGLSEMNVSSFSYNSGTFSQLTNFTTSSSTCCTFPTSITVDNGNALVVFYAESSNLYYVASTNGGSSWSAPQTLTSVVTSLEDLNSEFSSSTNSVGVIYLDYEGTGPTGQYLDFSQLNLAPASTTTTITTSLSDAVTISDSTSYSLVILKSLADVVGLSDQSSKLIGQLLSKGLSDTVSASDTLSKSIGQVITKGLSDSVTFSDQISQSIGHLIQKGLSDSLNFVDSLSHGFFFPISFNGNLVIQAHSPVNILVTDPHGNEIGCTASGTAINQISGATFSGCGTEPETITIPNPIAGNYEIQIFGNSQASTSGSSFTVTITTTDSSGVTVSSQTVTGTATPTFTQTLTYDIQSDGMITSSSIVPGVPEFPGSLIIVVLAILFLSLNYIRKRTRYDHF